MARFIKTDWVLFGTIVALVCFGLVMVYSSSSVMAEVKLKVTSVHFLVRQLGFAIASFFLLMYFKRQDYRLMKNPVWAFTGLGAVLILQVAVFFADTRAHRWFRIAGVSLQPSEFAKPALIVFLAYFVCLRLRAINERHTIRPVALALAVVGVTVGMGDLGTAIVLVVPAAILFYVAGLERRGPDENFHRAMAIQLDGTGLAVHALLRGSPNDEDLGIGACQRLELELAAGRFAPGAESPFGELRVGTRRNPVR